MAIDPSKRCTGLVFAVIDGREIHVMRLVTLDFLTSIRGTDQRILFQRNYGRDLYRILDEFQPTGILSEYPHGSQSAAAAWMLSSVTQAVACYEAARGVRVRFVHQRKARMDTLGTNVASKREIVELVVEGMYRKRFTPQASSQYKAFNQAQREAVADALVILNYYLKDITKLR